MKNILISRTDNIGDLILTLPLAGYIKSKQKNVRIGFLVKSYTKDLALMNSFVDYVVEKEDLYEDGVSKLKALDIDSIIYVFPDKEVAKWAFLAKIPIRIGTSHKWFHWMYANRLVHFSRNKSKLHEATLNLYLLKGIGIPFDSKVDLKAYYGIEVKEPILTDKFSKTIILHPKSKGSAREWPLSHYVILSQMLLKKGHKVFISGTKDEAKRIMAEMPNFLEASGAEDHTGRYDMHSFILWIQNADVLVACSTGPLHIAAMLGIRAIGIYPPARPMHPGRWQPLGQDVHICVKDLENCQICIKNKALDCACIRDIIPEQVLQLI